MNKHIAFALLPVFLIASCGLKDKEGDKPDDIVRSMIDAVQEGKYAEAASYWKAGDVKNIEDNQEKTFEEYCRTKFVCDTYTLSEPKKDKSCYIVYFYGVHNGTNRTYSLYVEYIENKWLLREQLIVNPEHIVPVK